MPLYLCNCIVNNGQTSADHVDNIIQIKNFLNCLRKGSAMVHMYNLNVFCK